MLPGVYIPELWICKKFRFVDILSCYLFNRFEFSDTLNLDEFVANEKSTDSASPSSSTRLSAQVCNTYFNGQSSKILSPRNFLYSKFLDAKDHILIV